jgi:hypothetical protein
VVLLGPPHAVSGLCLTLQAHGTRLCAIQATTFLNIISTTMSRHAQGG